MTTTDRPLRADARRNRDAVLNAAAELFARHGDAVQMDEVAAHAGLGVGTLYRHFADKQSLLAAIVGRRFAAMTAVAKQAEQRSDPGEAFEALLIGYLESAESDAAFRVAILGPEEPAWSDIGAEKDAFASIAQRIVERAVAAGRLREDFDVDDFVRVSRGAIANMDAGVGGWRRHVTLTLEGVLRTPG